MASKAGVKSFGQEVSNRIEILQSQHANFSFETPSITALLCEQKEIKCSRKLGVISSRARIYAYRTEIDIETQTSLSPAAFWMHT